MSLKNLTVEELEKTYKECSEGSEEPTIVYFESLTKIIEEIERVFKEGEGVLIEELKKADNYFKNISIGSLSLSNGNILYKNDDYFVLRIKTN